MKKIFVLIIVFFFASSFQAQTSPTDAGKEELKKINLEMVKFYQQQKYDEALPLARKSVELSERVYGKEDLETARSLRNLGFVQYAKADEKAAEETFEKAYDIYKKFPDLDQSNAANLAEMLENLAFIKYQKRIDAAESFYQKALEWREKTVGADSVKVAKPLSALANINYWKKDYKKSAAQFERLLEILSKNVGNANDETVLAYRRTECSYRKAGMETDFALLKQKYSAFEEQQKTKTPPSAQLINGGVINGKAINLVKPPYPIEARRARASGSVNVEVMINEEGKVIYACAAKAAHPALIEGSEAAAYQSEFSPTILKGSPIRVFGTLVYNYSF